jgi:hypothetical protein
MWFKALEIASHINLPIPVVAFALVFAVFVFCLALRSRKTGSLFWLFLTTSLVICGLGLAPLASSTYLQSRDIYRISVQVIGPDKKRVLGAELSSLPAAQIKKTDTTWEIDVAPQVRPSDGTFILSASAEDAFLVGSTKVVLAGDYFPKATIQLEPLPPVTVRGAVFDDAGKPVQGATIGIEGYSETAKTNQMGNFEIPSHHASGQIVSVMAVKNGITAKVTGPAGEGFELVLRR